MSGLFICIHRNISLDPLGKAVQALTEHVPYAMGRRDTKISGPRSCPRSSAGDRQGYLQSKASESGFHSGDLSELSW